MKTFCHRCGRELDENEYQCPECGMPTEKGMSDPDFSRQVALKVRRNPIGPIVLVAILALALILVPFIMPGEATYKTTVTVVEVGITDDADGLYTEAGNARAFLVITVDGANADLPEGKDNYWIIPTDGTVVTLTENNTFTFSNTRERPSITLFLETYAPLMDSGAGPVKSGDIIDIYEEKNADRPVEYFGTTGVRLDVSDLDEEGYVTVNGDSQPIGHLKLKITVEKA